MKIFMATLLLVSSLCLPASAWSYSITNIMNYDDPGTTDLTNGNAVCGIVSQRLQGAGWTEFFSHSDASAVRADFGTDSGGYQGLDGAHFHWHYGHGVMPGTMSSICLSNYPYGYVNRDHVYKKWDNANKWTVIYSCLVLKDRQWGNALKTAHGILGFETTVTGTTSLPTSFFSYAIDNDYCMSSAWYYSTLNSFGSSVTAVAIADTQLQMTSDQLPGQGHLEPDEDPDDNNGYYSSWAC